MRYALTLIALLALLSPGCKKPEEGPKTTAAEPDLRPIDDLKPLDAKGDTAVQPERKTVDEAITAAEKRPGMTTGKGGKRKPADTPEIDKPEAPGEAAEPGVKYYTVQADDKGGYYAIARKLYGDQVRWKDIQALNPGVDSTKLKIGQKIKVPVK